MKIALDYSIVSFHCSDQDIKKIKGLQKKWKGSLMGWLCRNTSLNDKYKSTSKTLWQFVLCDLDYYHLFFDVQSDLEWNANIPPSVDPWIKLKRELQALAERRAARVDAFVVDDFEKWAGWKRVLTCVFKLSTTSLSFVKVATLDDWVRSENILDKLKTSTVQ